MRRDAVNPSDVRIEGWIRTLAFLLLLGAPAVGCTAGPDAAETVAGSSDVPAFAVDPAWPQEMPDLWVMGAVTAVFVDAQDHIWVTHLPETLTEEETSAVQDPPIGTCCAPAPTVIEFDADGAVVQAWGDPSDDISVYPRNPHGLFVDHNDYVWIGTYRHHRVMKFTRDGQHLMTIGEYDANAGSNDPDLLGGPAGIWVDPTTNEVFVADGYRNRRVVVYDGETGAYLRHWGAYGERPDDEYDYGDRSAEGPPPSQFSTVHGLIGSNDGLIYVADRRGNRIQVFGQDGAFVTEKIIAPRTLASGSAFVIALSPDPEQRWLFLADGTNHKVWTLRRDDLEVVGEFGRGGRQLGQFLRPHGMSIDSRGNLYVGEASTGRRVQKFALQPGSERALAVHDLLERIRDGRTDLIFEHLAAGGAATAADGGGVRLIQWCAYYGDVSAVRFLLEHGESLDSLGSNFDLNGAAFHGHWRLCQFLVERGADVDHPLPETGETPLHSALCKADQPRYELVVKVLLQSGADPNRTTVAGAETGSFMRDSRTKGEAPLHRAAAFGSEESIRMLLGHGAVVDAKDMHGETPLSWASWHNRPAHVLAHLCYGDHRIHPEAVARSRAARGLPGASGLAHNLLGEPRG